MAKDENKYVEWIKNHKIISGIVGFILFSMILSALLPKPSDSQMNDLKEKELQRQQAANQQKILEEQQKAQEQNKTEQKIVFNSEWDGSVKQVKDFLKANLNDWDSYESVEWSQVIEANLTTHKYVVRHKYRANNLEGNKILFNQMFYLDENGKVVNVKDWE